MEGRPPPDLEQQNQQEEEEVSGKFKHEIYLDDRVVEAYNTFTTAVSIKYICTTQWSVFAHVTSNH